MENIGIFVLVLHPLVEMMVSEYMLDTVPSVLE
jgi:hypothetical protein